MDSMLVLDKGLLWASLSSGLTFLLIYYHLRVFSFWKSRGIPGPTPWPLFGTTHYYLFKNRQIVDQEFRDKYGHIYGLYFGLTPVLRTSDNELIKYVYIEQFQQFTERDDLVANSKLMRLWLLYSSGDHWSNQRALMTPLFTSSRLKNMFPTVMNCATTFMKEIKFQSEVNSKSIISKQEVMRFTLDVVSRIFFSLKLDLCRDKTNDLFKRAFAFASFDYLHFLLWLMTPKILARYIGLDSFPYSKYEYFDKLSQSKIAERRQKSIKHNDFVQALLDARLPDEHEEIYSKDDDREAHYNDQVDLNELRKQQIEANKKAKFRKFEDLEIRGQMTFFFMAGLETTSTTLTFCFYELAHQQAIQQELYEEMMNNDKFLGGAMDHNDVMNLKKLDAFVSEVMRLHPPVLEHTRLVTNKNGVYLPTNPPVYLPYKCIISVPAFQVQRDRDYWQDGDKFDMSRFYVENRRNIKTCSYMPFGLGPRNCIAIRFALLTVKLTIVRILLGYQIRPSAVTKRYPPEYVQHAFFSHLEHTDFEFEPRQH